ncbi:hypothetical protein ARMSODRAFT_840740, partial [Armillaria solidipes]
VLAIMGWIGNLQNKPVHLRHNSCVDINLLSLEYYKTMVNPPSIRKGTKMNLWQLTDKDSKIEGYVSVPIFTLSENRELIETEVEAYVVPQMSVPILLGEDYQLNYELTVKWSNKQGVTILYGDQDKYSVKATLAKNHRCEKNRCKQKLHQKIDKIHLAYASCDVRIPAHSSKLVKVVLPSEVKEQWVIENNLIPNSPFSYLLVPNMLVEAGKLTRIPLSNLTSTPKMLRKGDIIGMIHQASEYFDSPQNDMHHEGISKTAMLMEKL